MHGKMWGACDFKERVIRRVILATNAEGFPLQEYMVGIDGVTSIRRVRMCGEQAYIPHLQIWKGTNLYAEVCQHRVSEVIYKMPNEFEPDHDDDAAPSHLTVI